MPFIPVGGLGVPTGRIPSPVLFEGAIIGATAISSQYPRPGKPPERQMSGVLGTAGIKRMSITDLSRIVQDDDPSLPLALEAHFNPSEMRETIKAIWSEIPIPGMSHKRLQYHLTENVPFQFDLHFDALQMTGASTYRGLEGPAGVSQARRFLQSLCFARSGEQAPPRVLFFWPNFLSITCVVTQEDWRYTMFQTDGTPRRFTCSMLLKEIRDTRLLSGDVLRDGGSKRMSPYPPDPGDQSVIKV